MTIEEQDEIRIMALKDMMWLKSQELDFFGSSARKEYLEVIQFAIDKVKDHWGINLTGDEA